MNNIFIMEGKRKRPAIQKQCERCFQDYIVSIYSADKQRFCSNTCSAKSRQNLENLKCDFCEKEFQRKKKSRKANKTQYVFCSRNCKNKAQRVESHLSDLKPDSYKDGAANYTNRARRVHEQKCVDCGENDSCLLVVHHKDGNRKNGDIFNLEMVCHNHHAIRHLRLKDGEWVYHSGSLTPPDELKRRQKLIKRKK